MKKSMQWHGRLSSDSAPDDFNATLKTVVALLAENRALWREFVSDGGNIELTLNLDIASMEGKVFELHFFPILLSQLAALEIGLRVQGWNRHSDA